MLDLVHGTNDFHPMCPTPAFKVIQLIFNNDMIFFYILREEQILIVPSHFFFFARFIKENMNKNYSGKKTLIRLLLPTQNPSSLTGHLFNQ